MTHDVFVSYSARDKSCADAVVASLEQSGIRCWIAPRDVLPGTSWGEAIVEAIEASRLMVLVLSESSNHSRQVLREVERAVNGGTIIVPFRIEEIEPSGAMAYYLATEHWLDALTPPLERHIRRLVSTAGVLLTGEPAGPVEEPRQPSRALSRARAVPLPVLAGGLALIGAVAGALLLTSLRGGGDEPAALSSPSTEATTIGTPPATSTVTSDPPPTQDTITIPPPMFDVPGGALATVTEAGLRWQQEQGLSGDVVEAGVVQLEALARERGSAWTERLGTADARYFAGMAAPALCQLTKEEESPDDVTSFIAVAAGEVGRQDGPDYDFAGWVVSVATASLCPEEAARWTVATGGLGAGVLLSDDFESRTGDWLTGAYEAGSAVIRDGTFRFLPAPTSHIMGSLHPRTFTDTVVDVWVWQEAGPGSHLVGYGVTCRETTTPPYGSFYLFTIKGDRAFEIWKYDIYGRGSLLTAGSSVAIHAAPRVNHLTVMCNGPTLAMAVNGEVLAVVDDNAYTKGGVSPFAYSQGAEGVEVVFDNLIVRTPSPEAIALLEELGAAAG